MKYAPEIGNYRVVLEFDYEAEILPGDPDDSQERADQEKEFLFSYLRDIPGLETDNLKMVISPS